MAPIPLFDFLTSLNWMYVLATILCGYVLYLKIIIKRKDTREAEIILDVLSFGIFAVAILYIFTGFLSSITGSTFLGNIYIEYALHVAIGLSAILIFQHHLRFSSFSANKVILVLGLYIALTIIYFFVSEAATLVITFR